MRNLSGVVLLGRDSATASEPGLASWSQVAGTKTGEGVLLAVVDAGGERERTSCGGCGGECGGMSEKDNPAELRVRGSWEKNIDAGIPSSPGYGEPIISILLRLRTSFRFC